MVFGKGKDKDNSKEKKSSSTTKKRKVPTPVAEIPTEEINCPACKVINGTRKPCNKHSK